MASARVSYQEGLEVAVLMLHEEAHPGVAFRMCSAEPCAEINRCGQVAGVAPHTMPKVAAL